jgi:dihydrofolate reductase
MRFRAYIAASVDGFVATPDGGIAWLEQFNGEAYGYNAFIRQIDAIVIGRRTFDQALSFPDWPYVGKDVYVLTSRPLERESPRTRAWHDSPAKLAAHLRGEALERDVWVLGGPKALHAFRELGVVDVYELFVLPMLLGDGIPLFERGLASASLRLTDQQVFADGVVQLVYEPAP